jgi:hypothetical protein
MYMLKNVMRLLPIPMLYKNTCMHILSYLFMLMFGAISKGAVNESIGLG